MKHRRLTLLTLPAAALFAFAVPQAAAQEAQFTFSANLSAIELHQNVAQVGFTCRICSTPECSGGNASFLGVEMLKFPINGQTAFNQSVTLGVNVAPGENPQAVEGWWCSLQVHDSPGFEQLPHPGAGYCIPDAPLTSGNLTIRHAVPARAVLKGSL